MTISPKSRLAATIFAFVLGMFGAHRFYVGKTGTAIAQLVLTCTVIFSFVTAIWNLVDFIMIVAGTFKDKNGLIVLAWDPERNVIA